MFWGLHTHFASVLITFLQEEYIILINHISSVSYTGHPVNSPHQYTIEVFAWKCMPTLLLPVKNGPIISGNS